MYILLTFLTIVYAASNKCTTTTHSKFYLANYSNPDVKFFEPTTYHNDDPCIVITNGKFRTLHSQYLKNNQVEHIIDISNSEPELAECRKDIMGNLVMANGQWNRGVGQLCWSDVKAEKSLVYGDIFQKALDSVKKCCSIETRHTQFYDDNHNGRMVMFYDSNTFGMDIHDTPCKKITNAKFRQFVNEKVVCKENLCNNGQYYCKYSSDKDCYHVQHIIDKYDPELQCGDCIDIVGNMVMVNGRWNNELHCMAIKYHDDSVNEKNIIFGQDIVERARAQIKQCSTSTSQTVSNEDVYDMDFDCDGLTLDATTFGLIILSCICVVLVIVIIAMCGGLCYLHGKSKVKPYDML